MNCALGNKLFDAARYSKHRHSVCHCYWTNDEVRDAWKAMERCRDRSKNVLLLLSMYSCLAGSGCEIDECARVLKGQAGRRLRERQAIEHCGATSTVAERLSPLLVCGLVIRLCVVALILAVCRMNQLLHGSSSILLSLSNRRLSALVF